MLCTRKVRVTCYIMDGEIHEKRKNVFAVSGKILVA